MGSSIGEYYWRKADEGVETRLMEEFGVVVALWLADGVHSCPSRYVV